MKQISKLRVDNYKQASRTQGFLSPIRSGGRRCLLSASVALFSIMLSTSCSKDDKPTVQQQEINQVRAAVSSLTTRSKAIDAGYNIPVTGYRTQMGYHLLNESLLDDTFEISKPEVLLYAPYNNDSMKLVAVEYATPIENINQPPAAPEGFTGSDDKWEVNTEFNLWTLHVWIGLDNPHGLFASHNPQLP